MSETKRRAIIVLGMHRSGTSALAGMLGLLGAKLPAQLLPGNASNPKGHFEPERIVAIHDRILASAGTTWSGWEEIPEAWFLSEPSRAFVDELVEAVSEDYGAADLCVIKDPRMCRLMPLWYRVLDRLDVKACFTIPLRDPVEVVRSLENRNRLPLAHGCLLWLRHVLDAERHTRGHPRVFLRYRDLLDDPRSVIDRMRTGLGVVWPRRVESSLEEIEDFLDPSLRTQAAREEDIDDMGDFSPWLRQAYECYEAQVRSPTDISASRQLDRLQAAFAASDAVFTPVFKHQAEQLDTELAALREALAARQIEVTTLGQAVAERDKQIASLGQVIAERDVQIASPGPTVAERDGQTVSHHQTVAERDVQIASLRQVVAERVGQIASLRQAVAERVGQIASLRQVVAERIGQIASLNQILAEREKQIASLGQTVAEHERQIVSLGQSIAERDRQVDALASQLEEIFGSAVWRLLAPLHWYGRQRQRAMRRLRKLLAFLLHVDKVSPVLHIAGSVERHDSIPEKVAERSQPLNPVPDLSKNELDNKTKRASSIFVSYNKSDFTDQPSTPASSNGHRYLCSLVIPTKNGGDLFRQVVGHLQTQTCWPDVEFIVIDSGSTDETISIAQSAGAVVYKIPPNEFNHGLTRDYGISLASSDFVILMVQDAIPNNNILIERLLSALNEDGVAGVYARQIPQPSADVITKRNLNSWLTGGLERKVKAIESLDWYEGLSAAEKYYFCNFDNVCSAINKRVWREDRFGRVDFGEDIDWAERVLKQKLKIIYEPSAAVVHSHDRSLIYEYKRTYICHRMLYRRFGLHLVPSFRGLWRAWFASSVSDVSFVIRAEKRITQILYMLPMIPLVNLLLAYSQYRAVQDEIRGTKKKM